MKIAICEDEKAYSTMLKNCIADCFKKMNKTYQISCYYNGCDFLDNFNSGYDMVFLDINLPDINGFEIAKKIRNTDENVMIIFVTAIDDYVYEGYEINAFRYILKNKIDESFTETITSICKEAEKHQSIHRDHIILKKNKRQIILKTRDILYITSSLRKLVFYTKNGCHEVYGKLSDFDFLENHNFFIKCHNAFIINIEHITSFDINSIYIDEIHRIPVSSINKTRVNTAIINYMSQRSVF